MKEEKDFTSLSEVGTAIGVGLIAGLAGTLAITISQMIEMKITGRESSDTPATAVREALDIKPVTESKTKKVSNKIHWVYGTNLGMIRGALSLAGLKGWAATAIHWATIWSAEMIMLPALRVAPPVTKESPKTIMIDGFHHLVYAVAAGMVFDEIKKEEQ